MTTRLWNGCDVCGRFIALDDFDKGAVRRLIYPDSERTAETWETALTRESFAACSGKGEATAFRRQNKGPTNMTNAVTTTQSNLPATYEEEADNLLSTTEGRDPLLKFVKGKYKIGEDEVPLGTQYVAHAGQLTFCWIKFVDGKKVAGPMGKAAEKWVPPEREDLGDNDQSKWEVKDGEPKDPWAFQRLLPFENLETGEVVIFTTQSDGGQIATDKLVREYARRIKRKGLRSNPIIRLGVDHFKSKRYGEIPCPDFEVTGWEDAPTGDGKQTAASELNDSVPF